MVERAAARWLAPPASGAVPVHFMYLGPAPVPVAGRARHPRAAERTDEMQQNGKLDVYLAVGHGVEPNGVLDPGAIGTDGRQEHQEAFQVCTFALAAMRRSGLTVVSETAQGASHDPDFHGSALRANQLQPRVAIEVHFDWSGGVDGFSGLYVSAQGQALAEHIGTAFTGPAPAPGGRRAPPRAVLPEQHGHAGAHPGDPPGARLAGCRRTGRRARPWPKAPARSSATPSGPRRGQAPSLTRTHRAPRLRPTGRACPGDTRQPAAGPGVGACPSGPSTTCTRGRTADTATVTSRG